MTHVCVHRMFSVAWFGMVKKYCHRHIRRMGGLKDCHYLIRYSLQNGPCLPLLQTQAEQEREAALDMVMVKEELILNLQEQNVHLSETLEKTRSELEMVRYQTWSQLLSTPYPDVL